MLSLSHDIEIGSYKVKHLLSVEVRKSANKLIDSATIKMSGMAYGSALEIEDKVKRGDAVTIKMGYAENGELPTEFTGYVSSIKTDNTIEIECEDGIFLFRTDVVNKQYKDVTAKKVVQDVVDQIGGFELVTHDGTDQLKYDKFTIDSSTGYEVLKKIADENRLHIFVKGDQIHMALQFTYKEGDVAYDFAANVEKSNLRYLKEEDKKVLIEVVGIKKDNKKVVAKVGVEGGDKITIHKYNVTDKAALSTIGLEELKKYRYTGYDGDLRTWLLPWCTYGYTAEVIDPEYPTRQGKYYVEAVTSSMSSAGGIRKVTLGIKVA